MYLIGESMCGQNIKIVSTKPQMLPRICIKGCSDDIHFYIQKLITWEKNREIEYLVKAVGKLGLKSKLIF